MTMKRLLATIMLTSPLALACSSANLEKAKDATSHLRPVLSKTEVVCAAVEQYGDPDDDRVVNALVLCEQKAAVETILATLAGKAACEQVRVE